MKKNIKEVFVPMLKEVPLSSNNILVCDEEISIIGNSSLNYTYTRIPINQDLKRGEVITISIEDIIIKSGNVTEIELAIRDYNFTNQISAAYGFINVNTKTVSLSIVNNLESPPYLWLYAGRGASTYGNSITFKRIMVVKSRIPMAWMPSPSQMGYVSKNNILQLDDDNSLSINNLEIEGRD